MFDINQSTYGLRLDVEGSTTDEIMTELHRLNNEIERQREEIGKKQAAVEKLLVLNIDLENKVEKAAEIIEMYSATLPTPSAILWLENESGENDVEDQHLAVYSLCKRAYYVMRSAAHDADQEWRRDIARPMEDWIWDYEALIQAKERI